MTEEAPRRRWGSGFIWGCLTPLLVIGFVVLCAVGYGAYYMTLGYKNDSGFQTVMATLQSNPVARAVLGDGIAVNGMPSFSFKDDTTGHTESYTLSVQGSKASGTVHAFLIITGGQSQIKTMVLTGPNGQNYNLIGNAAPGAPTNAVWLLPARQTQQPA